MFHTVFGTPLLYRINVNLKKFTVLVRMYASTYFKIMNKSDKSGMVNSHTNVSNEHIKQMKFHSTAL
jgi:hypothetical protein